MARSNLLARLAISQKVTQTESRSNIFRDVSPDRFNNVTPLGKHAPQTDARMSSLALVCMLLQIKLPAFCKLNFPLSAIAK